MLPTSLSVPAHRVLIVDRSPESREVLRTVLERRGIEILEAAGARQGVALVQRHRPEVIVLDLEADAADDELVQDQFDAASREHHACLVVLGRARRYEQALPKDRIVPKPYHYGPLVRTIEQLLDASTGS